ncbi:MAG: hypothetical protein IID33_07915, partial [Planctomycetes bacterium]|nr:hypothetical protein [Planctomycetota bacterium]
MATVKRKPTRRASITLMIVGLLAMLFVLVSAYITLARFDRVTGLKYERAQHVDQAIDSINDLVLSKMRDQFVDANGKLFGGAVAVKDTTGNGTPDTLVGGQFEDVAGHGKSRFGGGLEPFFDFAATSPIYGSQPVTVLNSRRFVSSTGPSDGTGTAWTGPSFGLPIPPLPGVSMRELVSTQSFSETGSSVRLLFDVPANYADDWAQLARSPYMDADGDGVPDASFEHTANLQELVNAIFGRMVRAPTIKPIGGSAPLLWQEMWQRFDLTARFEVAIRVAPHSGMVALDSYKDPLIRSNDPVTRLPFNRFFVREMFQWVRADNRNVPRAGNSFYNEVHLNRRAIGPILRRRGLLASWRDGRDTARIPDVLRRMERD